MKEELKQSEMTDLHKEPERKKCKRKSKKDRDRLKRQMAAKLTAKNEKDEKNKKPDEAQQEDVEIENQEEVK